MKHQAFLEEMDVEVETRCGQLSSMVEQLVAALNVHFRMQLEALPKAARAMTMKQFMAKHGGDVSAIGDSGLREALSAFPVVVEPPPSTLKRAPLSVKGTGTISRIAGRSTIKKTRSAVKKAPGVSASPPKARRTTRSQSIIAATPAKGVVPSTPLNPRLPKTPAVKSAARLPRKGDSIMSSTGSPLAEFDSDASAQIVLDKENNISSLAVAVGANGVINLADPNVPKNITVMQKKKVVNRIEALRSQMDALLTQLDV